MAFHKTKKIPTVNEDDVIVIRTIMTVTMSFDHRVTDGGNAVAFTNHLIINRKPKTINAVLGLE